MSEKRIAASNRRHTKAGAIFEHLSMTTMTHTSNVHGVHLAKRTWIHGYSTHPNIIFCPANANFQFVLLCPFSTVFFGCWLCVSPKLFICHPFCIRSMIYPYHALCSVLWIGAGRGRSPDEMNISND